jgi:type IV secretion system protein VirD4
VKRLGRRLLGWLIGFGLLAVVLAALVLAVASLAFLKLQGITTVQPPRALWCWLEYWRAYGEVPDIRRNLLIAIGAPGAFVVLLLGVMVSGFVRARPRLRPARPGQKPPAPVRAASDTHGNAEWMPIKEARQLFPGPHPEYGGVVIGEAYRVDEDSVADRHFDPADKQTWGKGGKAPLLIDPCTANSTHGLVFAGSGGFKTTAIAVPTLTQWTGTAVVLDPSCQLGPMTATMRAGMGHKTVQVGPGLDGFNPLDWIDIKNPLAEAHVQMVVEWVTGESAGASGASKDDDKNNVFSIRGKELIKCLLADLLWSERPAKEKTLRALRKRIATPEKQMKGLLADIHEESKSPLARDLAGTLMDVFHETFSGMYSNAVSSTEWLSITVYADMVSGSTFRTPDLRAGNLTVYVQIPMESLRATPALARVVIGALLNGIYLAEGKIKGRALFLLDEVNFLSRLKALEDARDAGRKYGITLVPMWQSLGQLIGTWGPNGKASWFNSASWRLFAAIDDTETAKDISETCGRYTVLRRTEGRSTGSNSGNNSGSRSTGRNEGLSEGVRELIRPDEIATRMRTDEQILFRRNSKPLRCGRAIYFRRPEMVAKVEADRFRTAAE